MHPSQKLYEACKELPIFDMVWFHQNIQSLSAMDENIRDIEAEVLTKLIDTEKTPVIEALYLQSLSQCWMFGMYELFRTWRQMINELMVFADQYEVNPKKAKTPIERSDLDLPELDELLEHSFYGSLFDKIKSDTAFRDKLIRTKAVFKTHFAPIEELRVLVAKFEIPQTGQGQRRFAMPYARISYENGSMYWFVTLKDGQRNFASRQDIANQYIVMAKAINNA